MVFFLPEFKTVRDDVRMYAASYGFALTKDWWAMNELPLCLPTDTKLTPRPQFVFNKSGGLSAAEVKALNIFFNRTTSKTQLMQGDVSWRGAREKDPESLKFLIKALTKPGDVVLDAYASICASIHACHRSGQHLVAFERNSAIFNAILAPLRDSAPSPIVGGSQSQNMADEDDEEPVRKVPKKSHLSAKI